MGACSITNQCTCTADSCGPCVGGCANSCSGCSGSCKTGCKGGCKDGCTSCTGSCSGGCSGSCKDTCFNTCSGKCNIQCKNLEQNTLMANLPDYPINRKIFASDIIPLQKATIYQCDRRKIKSTTILCKESLKIKNEDINRMINDLNSIKVNSISFNLIEGQKINAKEFKIIKEEIIDRYNELVRVD